MWGALCCVSLTFAYFLVPETKGLSLEQIDKMLEESTPRTSRRWVPHSTFAEDMGLTHKGVDLAHGTIGTSAVEEISHLPNEKSAV